MAEQLVQQLAHWKGCEVFRNVGCTGPIDLVIYHPKLGLLPIDVKCMTERLDGTWCNPSIASVPADVFLVYVRPKGDVRDWKVQWRNTARGIHSADRPVYICPPGWENFWDNDHRNYSTK
ncbi:hypothetical protein P60_gp17 [Synechococcus phage P60]|uniref:Uncharacterized protein n=1 Tax=Synechococcus phage P60 TaxID=2905923 RepID=Q8W717_9CAUD|nr:hypothetical protein P60_gp17 [Synechococcus phage P60]AAL73260.2 hypothetical protein P60_gp17 [Synechococcus phage P60]